MNREDTARELSIVESDGGSNYLDSPANRVLASNLNRVQAQESKSLSFFRLPVIVGLEALRGKVKGSVDESCKVSVGEYFAVANNPSIQDWSSQNGVIKAQSKKSLS